MMHQDDPRSPVEEKRPEPPTADGPDGLSMPRPMFLGSLSFGMLTFVLPIYGKRLGASAVEIGGMFSAVAIPMAAIRPFLGGAEVPFYANGIVLLAIAVWALLLLPWRPPRSSRP